MSPFIWDTSQLSTLPVGEEPKWGVFLDTLYQIFIKSTRLKAVQNELKVHVANCMLPTFWLTRASITKEALVKMDTGFRALCNARALSGLIEVWDALLWYKLFPCLAQPWKCTDHNKNQITFLWCDRDWDLKCQGSFEKGLRTTISYLKISNWHELRRCNRAFRRSTGNDVSGHYFHHYFRFVFSFCFSVAPFSHRRSAPIKKPI